MLDMRAQADDRTEGSLAHRMRARRFEIFAALAGGFGSPIRILDVGGLEAFWKTAGWANREDVQITLLNLTEERTESFNITSVAGDATDLSHIADEAYDIAFSNSVIEHLFTYRNQHAMAYEIRRVARAHWVQTPNYWFPFEPHFHAIGWQWLPRSVRVGLVRRMRCGQRGPCADREQAAKLVDEVRLMTKGEMRACFPGSMIWEEKLGGLTKSLVAYGGFPEAVIAEPKSSPTVQTKTRVHPAYNSAA